MENLVLHFEWIGAIRSKVFILVHLEKQVLDEISCCSFFTTNWTSITVLQYSRNHFSFMAQMVRKKKKKETQNVARCEIK